jgi:transposase
MTVPGVGPVVAVTFQSAVDEPTEGGRSAVRLTPKKYQSGEKDVTGGITRTGDEMVRTALGIILHRMWTDGTTYRWAETKPIAAQD